MLFDPIMLDLAIPISKIRTHAKKGVLLNECNWEPCSVWKHSRYSSQGLNSLSTTTHMSKHRWYLSVERMMAMCDMYCMNHWFRSTQLLFLVQQMYLLVGITCKWSMKVVVNLCPLNIAVFPKVKGIFSQGKLLHNWPYLPSLHTSCPCKLNFVGSWNSGWCMDISHYTA